MQRDEVRDKNLVGRVVAHCKDIRGECGDCHGLCETTLTCLNGRCCRIQDCFCASAAMLAGVCVCATTGEEGGLSVGPCVCLLSLASFPVRATNLQAHTCHACLVWRKTIVTRRTVTLTPNQLWCVFKPDRPRPRHGPPERLSSHPRRTSSVDLVPSALPRLHHPDFLTMSPKYRAARKSSDAENAGLKPRAYKKLGRVSSSSVLRDSALLRRKRVLSGITASKALLEHVKQQQQQRKVSTSHDQVKPKTEQVTLRFTLPTPPASPMCVSPVAGVKAAARHTKEVRLPLHLPRPAPEPVSREALESCDPEIEPVPTDYLRAGLYMLGPKYVGHF